MAADLKPLQNYIHALAKALAAGDATEHTHRPALKALLESLDTTILLHPPYDTVLRNTYQMTQAYEKKQGA